MTKPAIPPIGAGSPPLEDLSPDSAPPYHHSPTRRLAGHVRKTKNMTFEDRTTQPTTKKPFYKRLWFVIPVTAIVAIAAFIGIIFAIPGTNDEPTREQLFEAGKQACYTELLERNNESMNRAVGWEGRHSAYIEQGETTGYMEFEIEVVTGRLIPWPQKFRCDFDATTLPATVTSLSTSDTD